jgi:hypothetical protein
MVMMVMVMAVMIPVMMAFTRLRRARHRQTGGCYATQNELMQQFHLSFTSFEKLVL